VGVAEGDRGGFLSVGELIALARTAPEPRLVPDERGMVHTAAGNAAWCPAMLARGDTLDDLWRFCVLQTLDDYTSTLRWGGAQEAARVFAEEPAPTGAQQVDAALAALAEHLAERDGWEAPAWAGDPARTTTWYPDLLEMDRHEATHHGPKAFRRHGVFITHRALGRA